MASRDLKTLVDIEVFKDSGAKGAGAFYELNLLHHNCAYCVIVASQTC